MKTLLESAGWIQGESKRSPFESYPLGGQAVPIQILSDNYINRGWTTRLVADCKRVGGVGNLWRREWLGTRVAKRMECAKKGGGRRFIKGCTGVTLFLSPTPALRYRVRGQGQWEREGFYTQWPSKIT